jgi:hypothetical protein
MEKNARIKFRTHDYTIRRMRVACWLGKARNTQSEYLENILFPHQQQLHIPTTMSFL